MHHVEQMCSPGLGAIECGIKLGGGGKFFAMSPSSEGPVVSEANVLSPSGVSGVVAESGSGGWRGATKMPSAVST
jgi:hypothetical protein